LATVEPASQKDSRKAGPTSIAGNMRMPVSFKGGAPCRSLGAVTRNAAVQETVKVSAKYETAGCWQIKEDFAAEVDGESMVNEGCYSFSAKRHNERIFERGGRE